MSSLITVLELIIFIGTGVLIWKLGIFSDNSLKDLSTFLIDIVIPCTIVQSMQVPFSVEQLKNGLTMILLGALSIAISGLTAFAISRPKGIARNDRAMIMAGGTFMNYSFLGFPVMQALYGDNGLFLASMNVIIIRILYFVCTPFLLTGTKSSKEDTLRSIRKTLISPPIISVFLGFVLFLSGVQIPNVFLTPIKTVSDMTTPLGLIICGMSIAKIKINKTFHWNALVSVLLCRNLLSPLFYLVIAIILGVSGLPLEVSTMITALPVGSLITTFCIQAGQDDCTAGTMVLCSTILSIVTIPLLTLLFTALPGICA